MPAPGSKAEEALKARRARKRARRGEASTDVVAGEVVQEAPQRTGQRVQPKRKERNRGPAEPTRRPQN